MASTNKTERLGLNNWEAGDRPQRNDFNSDNLIVDAVLGEHVEDTGIHLTSTEKARVSRPVQVISYAGDGQESNRVTLPVEANAVIVYRDDMPCAVYDSSADCTKVYSALAVYGGGATSGIQLNGKDAVTVYQSASVQGGVKHCMNETDGQYKIAIIR